MLSPLILLPQQIVRLVKSNAIKFLSVFLCFSFFLSSPSLGQGKSLQGKDLLVMGRSAITDQHLELVSSGVHFGISFKGKECQLIVSLSAWQDHNYLQYELDGVYQKRLKIEGGSKGDTLTVVAPASGEHTLWIYKATEAHTGPIFIHQVVGKGLKKLSIPQRPLIEFIGNSITCGAAADPSEVPCGSGEYHDQHNAYLAYGPRASRVLGADFVLSSVSGIGIYRNWNSDNPVMPKVYEKVDFQEEGTRPWDFKTFEPTIVTIALGTNDFSRGDGKKPRLPFDSATFTAEYIKFVKLVKSKYPKAQVALTNSPMVSGADNDLFVTCLKKVKRIIGRDYPNDKPVAIFLYKTMSPRGCSYHPSVEDHQLMADQITPFLRNLLYHP